MELNSKQRAYLRSLSNDLDVIVHIGKDGIGDNLVKQANDALASALEKADDPEFLQELARDQLGYVTPGEKSFYDVSN
jgi:hypothetical protein